MLLLVIQPQQGLLPEALPERHLEDPPLSPPDGHHQHVYREQERTHQQYYNVELVLLPDRRVGEQERWLEDRQAYPQVDIADAQAV